MESGREQNGVPNLGNPVFRCLFPRVLLKLATVQFVQFFFTFSNKRMGYPAAFLFVLFFAPFLRTRFFKTQRCVSGFGHQASGPIKSRRSLAEIRTYEADRFVPTYKNGLEFHQQQKFLLDAQHFLDVALAWIFGEFW